MGSRSIKIASAMRLHVEAVASPVACTQPTHETSSNTNETGPSQCSGYQPIRTFLSLPRSCDDIDLNTSTHQNAPSRRRYSETVTTATMTSQFDTHAIRHLAAFESLIHERGSISINTFSANTPVQEEKNVDGPEIQCIACCSHLPKEKDPSFSKEAIKPCRLCDSAYCISCVKDMFLKACKDSTRMPPRCCAQIHLHYIRSHLTSEEISEYKLKYEVWSTPQPFYCPIPTCSTFISERLLPQHSIKEKTDSAVGLLESAQIRCPECAGDICVDCRQVAHPGSLCANLDLGVDADTAALLKAWGYKRCPKCSQGLRRMYGCNHVVCRCGAHICWSCMKSMGECEGSCYEQEDDEDVSDVEFEEPELPSGEDNNTSDEASLENIRHNDTRTAETSATSQTTEHVADNFLATTHSAARPRNLDGGSARYWEDEDLDFGEEPTEDLQDATWNCHHQFEPYSISIAEAISTPLFAHEMECVKCLSAIQPHIETQPDSKPSSAKMPRSQTPAARVPGGLRAHERGTVARLRPAVYVPPRGLVWSDTIIGTAPHLVEQLPIGSSRPTEARPDSMDSVQSGSESDHRGSEATMKVRTADSRSNIFSSPVAEYKVAQECIKCSLLVCRTCADLTLVRQEADEVANEGHEDMQPEDDTDFGDEVQGSVEALIPTDVDERPRPLLHER